MSLINPKFNKDNSLQSNDSLAAGKRLKKISSATENNPEGFKETKMKQWKLDFYRDQDRNKMQTLSKKLKSMRNKSKSASNLRKVASSHSKTTNKTGSNKSKTSTKDSQGQDAGVRKMSNRKPSKNAPLRGANRRIIK